MPLYTVVLPDDLQYDKEYSDTINGRQINDLIDDAVRFHKLSTAATSPQTIKAKIVRHGIINNKLQALLVGVYERPLPLRGHTEDEYNAAMKDVLKDIPNEFHPFINYMAYDMGHSAGYSEILNYAQELAYNLKPCIEKYNCR